MKKITKLKTLLLTTILLTLSFNSVANAKEVTLNGTIKNGYVKTSITKTNLDTLENEKLELLPTNTKDTFKVKVNITKPTVIDIIGSGLLVKPESKIYFEVDEKNYYETLILDKTDTVNKFQLEEIEKAFFGDKHLIELLKKKNYDDYLVLLEEKRTNLEKKLTNLSKEGKISNLDYRYLSLQLNMFNARMKANLLYDIGFKNREKARYNFELDESLIKEINFMDYDLFNIMNTLLVKDGIDLNNITEITKYFNEKIKDQEVKNILIGTYINRYLDKAPINDINKNIDFVKKFITSSKIKNTIDKKLDSLKIISKGKKAKDFTLYDINNKPIKISEYKNKFILLHFWASWCNPCKVEHPHMIKTIEELKKYDNFVPILVSVDDNKKEWLKALKEWKHSDKSVNLIAPNGFEDEIVSFYNIEGIPASILIDENFNVVSIDAPSAENNLLKKEILKYLKK